MNSKPNRTQIPVPGGSGLTPTGAMEFRDDWPGLFVRGDKAGEISCAVRRLQQHCSDHEHWEVQTSLRVLGEIADIIENDVFVRRGENGDS
jgi:hypothetical protein